MDAADLLLTEVRELVRARGIDPLKDNSDLERLVTEAEDDYLRRSDAGLVPPLVDPTGARCHVLDSMAGLGPLQNYLDDESIEEIWINAPGRVFIARSGRPELTTTILENEDLTVLVERMLRASGRRLDLSSPFVDAQLAGGQRLHVVIPPITAQHWAVNIRKHTSRASRTSDLVRMGSLTSQVAAFLDASVQSGLNILVSGATQAGKTTMVRALAGAIPGGQRVISCEEVFDITKASGLHVYDVSPVALSSETVCRRYSLPLRLHGIRSEGGDVWGTGCGGHLACRRRNRQLTTTYCMRVCPSGCSQVCGTGSRDVYTGSCGTTSATDQSVI